MGGVCPLSVEETLLKRLALVAMLALLGCSSTPRKKTPKSPPQGPTPPPPGVEVIDGDIDASDPLLTGGEFYDEHNFAGQAGDTLEVWTSADFDAYLIVNAPGIEQTEDDDAGDGNNAYLRLVLPEDGEVEVLVTTSLAGQNGTYRLHVRLEPAGGPAPRVPVEELAVRPGQTLHGRLEAGDETYNSGEWVDYYAWEAVAGSALTVTLRSADFDAFLSIHGPDDTAWGNDDGGGGRDASLVIEADQDGHYRIGATSYAAGELGAYSISFGELRDASPEADDRLDLAGELRAGDATLTSGEFFERHLLRVRAGDALRIFTQGSTDTYLMVDLPGQERQWDDDAGVDANAMLQLEATQDGEALVLVTTSQPGQVGAYRLIIEGASGALADEVYNGSLAGGDGELSSGEFRDTYALELAEGEEVELTLVSHEFNPYLIVKPPAGKQLENDDMNDGWRTSRISFQAQEAGSHEVLVTSAAPSEVGRYVLNVRRSSGGTQIVPEVQEVRGELRGGADGDARLQDGEYCDFYSFEGRAGQVIELRMDSSDLDAYLVLSPPEGDTLENDDRVEGDSGATINCVLTSDGTVRVWATSYAIETGAYRLSLRGASSVLHPDASQAIQPTRTYWALICGISDYRGVEPDLLSCREDAERLAERLIQDGIIARERVMLLVDADVTADRLRSAFTELSSKVGSEDVFLFFYSGHGAQGDPIAPDEADECDEFLVTVDGWLSDDELGRLYDEIQAKISILVLDACFSGGFSKDVITKPRRFGLFSSEEDLSSQIAEEFNAGGYLAHFFRRGLRGEADFNGDKSITVGELCEFLHRSYNQLEIETETSEGAIGYQHLVVDRGGVKIFEELLRLP